MIGGQDRVIGGAFDKQGMIRESGWDGLGGAATGFAAGGWRYG